VETAGEVFAASLAANMLRVVYDASFAVADHGLCGQTVGDFGD
jgi:hypothetical protein